MTAPGPSDAELTAALARTGYVYKDPVTAGDPDITPADPADLPDAFPPGGECHA